MVFFLFILFCKVIHRYLIAKSAVPLSLKFPFLGVVFLSFRAIL